ncbi:pyridoxamine 5'-phosphate oxidase family protein [Nocardiopsis sp. NPDC049922]|uniref:pyridoxamine 5'-phosphate oxidase family protein n=1 Tax=Nocardiopsis sp. NPDC049922 TaxID=3155157 RepID=UPI0033C8FB43
MDDMESRARRTEGAGAMSRNRVGDFGRIRGDFDRIVGSVVYATMTTVDGRGRPRARVLVPVWETDGDRPVGWLATHPTPVKTAHLAGNPHTTLSYWSPAQNTVAVDAVATWADAAGVRRRVWELYRVGSPPGAGYDPGAYWSTPDDPEFRVLRLDPWRIQVLRGADLVRGAPSRIWRAPDVKPAPVPGR